MSNIDDVVLYSIGRHGNIMYVELTPEDERIIKSYADIVGVSSEEIVRRAVREYINESEDDPELDCAIARYKTNPVTYSMEDVKKRYGLR